MIHEFVLDGETVKLRAEFKGFDGGHIDPDEINLTVLDSQKNVLLDVGITEHYRVSPGIYCFDYIVERGFRGELVYEFCGLINEEPIIIRDIIEVVGYIANTTQPSLYGN